jgi:Rieske Fe-S protein
MTEPDLRPASARLERRTVLRGAVVGGVTVAGAALLAACGGDTASSGASSGASSTPEPTSPDSPTPSSTDSVAALVPASDVPKGGGVVLADQEVVVTQPTAGDFRGFSAICTHQGCVVSDVSDGVIVCPCHGSQFSIEDGSVQAGPAPSPLPEVGVTVDGGNVVRA